MVYSFFLSVISESVRWIYVQPFVFTSHAYINYDNFHLPIHTFIILSLLLNFFIHLSVHYGILLMVLVLATTMAGINYITSNRTRVLLVVLYRLVAMSGRCCYNGYCDRPSSSIDIFITNYLIAIKYLILMI